MAPGDDLFRGPHSVRYPSEMRSFWITLFFAPITAGIIAALLHSPFRVSEIGIIIVLAMVYVTIARGRLLGTSVRVTERHFPEISAVVNRCCNLFGIALPQVFVREDFLVPITAMGLGEPYAIVISSEWLRHFDEDELRFLVGCELAHIAAGHTRISSLFSASGRENPLIALVFGAWLRRTEYTADRVGLLCCQSLEAATRAIYATTFRELKQRVDLEAFIQQRRAIESDPSLAMGEWLTETPYAVNRLRQLSQFAASDNYRWWTTQLRQRAEPASTPPVAARREAAPAGFFLRSLAFVADLIAVGTIVVSGKALVSLSSPSPDLNQAISELAADPDSARIGHFLATHKIMLLPGLSESVIFVVFFLYSALMVGLVGRTCGMMVFDLRVARGARLTPGIFRSIWRYVLAFLTFFFVVPWFVGALSGWWMHERLSGTRLVRGGLPSAQP
jgi:Zn-dependent protease with chaperone function